MKKLTKIFYDGEVPPNDTLFYEKYKVGETIEGNPRNVMIDFQGNINALFRYWLDSFEVGYEGITFAHYKRIT